MPKPDDISGGRDYGRRLYASPKDFTEQVRMTTDKFIDNHARVPHSEGKKPYLPDQDYPEMEHFRFEWDGPNWPQPPTVPDDPNAPDLPDVPPWNPPPKKDYGSPFLGCGFYWPLTPRILEPGETAYAKLARRDDPIIGFEIHGPATLVSSPTAAALCTSAGQRAIDDPVLSASYCTVIIRANNDVSGFDPDETGNVLIVLVATTLSGGSCSTSAYVRRCSESALPPVWDWINSGHTIPAPGSAAVFILDGTPPFRWSVSGEGFSLAEARTLVRSNTVTASEDACGAAKINVVDACGKRTSGSLAAPNGEWVYQGAVCLPECAAIYAPSGGGDIVIGGTKCTEQIIPAFGSCGSSQCGGPGGNCGNCEDAYWMGESCMAVCETYQPGKCQKCMGGWDSEGPWPCYASTLCPNGAYLALTCMAANLAGWYWECPA